MVSEALRVRTHFIVLFKVVLKYIYIYTVLYVLRNRFNKTLGATPTVVC